jgi:hypothetical protein
VRALIPIDPLTGFPMRAIISVLVLCAPTSAVARPSGKAMMDLRIVRGTARPGQVEAVARLWEETVGVKLAELSEFRHAYVGGDRGGTTFSVVTVWERFPDPAISRRLLQGFESRAHDLIVGSLAVEEFALLVEI